MVKIIINTNTAAFTDEIAGKNDPDRRNEEVARILENLAAQLKGMQGVNWESVILLDFNGNAVGSYTYSPTDED